MPKRDYSRRDFLKRNSIAGIGAVLASGIPLSIIANARFVKNETPAILGGKPTFENEWPIWPQWIPESDEKGVLDVLRSGIWSRKNVVLEFEEKWAQTIGAKRSLAVVNGTNAIIVSLIQNNIGAGDEVIIPPYTYIATPAAVLATGAMPIFVDIDPKTFQMDVSKIEDKITKHTKAIVPVHFAGLPADMIKIMDIAKRHHLIVIEDACQAHLAEIDHKKVGTFGNAGCFSFQNTKNLAIGEGGAIVSDDEKFIDGCFAYHNFGNPHGTMKEAKRGDFVIRGNKLRMSEYQAAIGLAQLKRLDDQTSLRNENASVLKAELERITGIHPYQLVSNVTRGAHYLFPFRYKKEEFKNLSRSGFINALNAEGITCWEGYTPINTMPYLEDTFNSKNYQRTYSKETLNFDNYKRRNHCAENETLCNEAVWLPQNVLLTDRSRMTKIAEAVNRIRNNADKIKEKNT